MIVALLQYELVYYRVNHFAIDAHYWLRYWKSYVQKTP